MIHFGNRYLSCEVWNDMLQAFTIYSKIDICMELDLSKSLFDTIDNFRNKYFDE